MQERSGTYSYVGLSPKTCKWIYTTVVRPILSYSATVWVKELDNKNNLKKLEKVRALALRVITGAFSSTPFNSLNHLTKTPHIGCYLKGEAAKGAARLQGYNFIMTGQLKRLPVSRVPLNLTDILKTIS